MKKILIFGYVLLAIIIVILVNHIHYKNRVIKKYQEFNLWIQNTNSIFTKDTLILIRGHEFKIEYKDIGITSNELILSINRQYAELISKISRYWFWENDEPIALAPYATFKNNDNIIIWYVIDYNDHIYQKIYNYYKTKIAQQVDAPEPATMIFPAWQHLSGRPGDL